MSGKNQKNRGTILMRMFYPDRREKSAYTIDYADLYRKGYRGVIFDIDNTLVPQDVYKRQRYFRSRYQLPMCARPCNTGCDHGRKRNGSKTRNDVQNRSFSRGDVYKRQRLHAVYQLRALPFVFRRQGLSGGKIPNTKILSLIHI